MYEPTMIAALAAERRQELERAARRSALARAARRTAVANHRARYATLTRLRALLHVDDSTAPCPTC